MIGALPLIGIGLVAVGVYYFAAQYAEASTPPPPAANFLTAMTEQEYTRVTARLQLQAKPIVLIKFRPTLGGDAITAAQSAAMAQARAYPQIWVVMLLHGLGGGGGMDTQCGPDDGGVVVAAPYGGGAGSEVYTVCWPQNADPNLVRQNINIAAVDAKNLAAQAPTS